MEVDSSHPSNLRNLLTKHVKSKEVQAPAMPTMNVFEAFNPDHDSIKLIAPEY